MIQKIYDLAFPVGGGTIGAILQTSPHMEIAIHAFIAAVIGAITGYLIKKGLDYLWRKLKKK